MTENTDLLRVANDSGFPLQIAIQHSVVANGDSHGWQVLHTEHGWTNIADGKSGFIDLVLTDRDRFARLVVECKRVRDATWVFLSDKGAIDNRSHSKAWLSHYRNGNMNAFYWSDVQVDPATPEAQFCTVRGQSSNDKNTFLERIAGDLISSTEALALEEPDYRSESTERIREYFNVIITTASLAVAQIDPKGMSLSNGTLDQATFVDVPYVRVRKQFSLRPVLLTPSDYSAGEDVDYRRENTVFVVRADKLNDFLHKFDVQRSSLRRFDR